MAIDPHSYHVILRVIERVVFTGAEMLSSRHGGLPHTFGAFLFFFSPGVWTSPFRLQFLNHGLEVHGTFHSQIWNISGRDSPPRELSGSCVGSLTSRRITEIAAPKLVSRPPESPYPTCSLLPLVAGAGWQCLW